MYPCINPKTFTYASYADMLRTLCSCFSYNFATRKGVDLFVIFVTNVGDFIVRKIQEFDAFSLFHVVADVLHTFIATLNFYEFY